MFGQAFELPFSSSKDTARINTCFGAISTLLVAIVALSYAYLKAESVITGSDMNVIRVDLDQYFDDSEVFTRKQGLNPAFALTSEYDPRDEEMEAYVSMKLVHAHWHIDEEGKYVLTQEEKKMHPCSEAELGLTEDADPLAFPMNKQDELTVKHQLLGQLMCISDPEWVSIQGDYNTATAS